MKHHVIFVQPFPANHELLQGLIEFFNDFVEIHFIDLPGMHPDQPPLGRINVDTLTQNVQERIEKMNFDQYWLGGISFGFLIANKVRTDAKCRGLVALEPFLNVKELNQSPYHVLFERAIAHVACDTKAYKRIWRSNMFHFILHKTHIPDNIIDKMLDQIDPRTFFEIAEIVLDYNVPCRFRNKPTILMINDHDDVIRGQETRELFEKYVKDLLVINTTVKHYPENLNKDYFEQNVPEEDKKRMVEFMDKFVSTP